MRQLILSIFTWLCCLLNRYSTVTDSAFEVETQQKIEPIFCWLGYLSYLESLSGAIFYAQCVDADKQNLESRNKMLCDLNDELRVDNRRLRAFEFKALDTNERLLQSRNDFREKNLALTSECERLNVLLSNPLLASGERLG